MTAERWQQIERLFHEALELEPTERAAFLGQACGDDALLRREVESLLLSRQRPVTIIDDPPFGKAVRMIMDGRQKLTAGQTIDHYKVLSWLDAGGMGDVYLAEDQLLHRKVAIKLLPPSFTEDTARIERFRQEARAASALNHPNIITIYEIGQSGPLHFIAAEFIQGETLRQRMRGSPMALRETLDIAAQVASALASAHQEGIIHRDIKPENIMVRDDGYVKVLDFGIALLTEQDHVFDSGADTSSLTGAQPSAVRGTASYMSPEQARGEPLDSRTDLFSLGVVLYEMVTGRRPFEGEDSSDVIRSLLNDEPPPLDSFRRNVPVALERLIGRAIKKDRDERYQSAAEILSEIRRVRDQLKFGIVSERTAVSSVGPRFLDHRNAGWFLLSGVLAALAAGLDALLLGSGWQMRDSILLVIATLWALLFVYSCRKVIGAASSLADDGAFRGLAPFQEGDRDRFFGRESDTSALLDMVTRERFRFGVLYGESGSGKTSLLAAGLAPKLKEAGYLPVYCRSYKDPLATVVDECSKQSWLQPLETESPLDFLSRVAEGCDKGIILIFDQFEEFFVNFKTRREREGFASFVAACYREESLPVRFLFSIRSDFLYLICSEFDGRIPEPLMGERRYYLRSFDQDQTEEIISMSARSAGLPLEESLCKQVAHDLAADDTVLPSELQIVGEQLQAKRIFTLREYLRAGGKEQLVNSFLEEVIQRSQDEATARLVLRSLISDSDTRLTLPLSEIVRRTQRSRETVERTLKLFVESRLVREIQEGEPWQYELMHEYLVEKVNQTTGRLLDATNRANRMFRQYLSNYSLDGRTRIPLTRLWFIRRYSDIQRGERELELLRRSLRWGLIKWSALGVLAGAVMVFGAAWLSLGEEWDEAVLRDGHTKAVRQVAFSPDGRLLVSVSEDWKVIVWDFARRERLATFTDHTDTVSMVAFSVDGRWFATGGDGTVIIYDAARLEKVISLPGRRDMGHTIAFTPDGKTLVTPTDGETYNLWAVGRWDKVREVNAVGYSGGRLLLSPDSRRLVSQWWRVWDLATGQPVMGESSPTWGSAALSPDAKRLVTVDSAGGVSFWDVGRFWESGQRKLIGREVAHRERGRAVAYAPDGRLVASGGEAIILWDAATQTKLTRFEHTAVVMSLAFSPDGRSLVSAHGDGAILVWDVVEKERRANLNEHSAPVQSVAFSPDGKCVASASEDQAIILWDVDSSSKHAVLSGHQTRVSAVAISSDGDCAASCDLYGELILWDLAERRPIWKAAPPERMDREFNYCVAMSPDKRWIANSFGVYDSSSGKMVFDLRTRKHSTDNYGADVFGAAFSPDGRWLACVTVRSVVTLLEVETWQLRGAYEMAGSNFISVGFSPDSKWLVTGEDQGAVRLWQVDSLNNVAVIGHHSDTIKSVAFSPDGREVASAGDDRVIRLWDVGRRRLITTIGTHTAPVLSVAFSPDGRKLASGEHDRSVRVYTRHSNLWGYRFD